MSKGKNYWEKILNDYVEAWEKTSIKPKPWYEQTIGDDRWGTAKRYITTKAAKIIIENRNQTTRNRSATDNNRTQKDGSRNKKRTIHSANGESSSNESINRTTNRSDDNRNGANNTDITGTSGTINPAEEVLTNFDIQLPSQERKGPGAPKGNQNRYEHGLYSRFYTDEERQFCHNNQHLMRSIKGEMDLIRIRLARAVALEHAIDAEEAELPVSEVVDMEGDNGMAPTNSRTEIRRRPDFDSIIQRLTGRLNQLTNLHEKLKNDDDLTKRDKLTIQTKVIHQLDDDKITPIQAAYQLEGQGIPLPDVLKLQVKQMLDTTEPETEPGISEEELDALCVENKAKQVNEAEWLQERQGWLEEWRKENG